MGNFSVYLRLLGSTRLPSFSSPFPCDQSLPPVCCCVLILILSPSPSVRPSFNFPANFQLSSFSVSFFCSSLRISSASNLVIISPFLPPSSFLLLPPPLCSFSFVVSHRFPLCPSIQPPTLALPSH